MKTILLDTIYPHPTTIVPDSILVSALGSFNTGEPDMAGGKGKRIVQFWLTEEQGQKLLMALADALGETIA